MKCTRTYRLMKVRIGNITAHRHYKNQHLFYTCIIHHTKHPQLYLNLHTTILLIIMLVYIYFCVYMLMLWMFPELTVDSFHQLLSLLCRDFPYSLVRNASRITMDVKEVPTKGKFREFSLKIFILFFFSEFMNQSALAFRTIDQHATGKVKVSAFMEHLKGILGKNPNFRYGHVHFSCVCVRMCMCLCVYAYVCVVCCVC
mmetsp:Transcript_10388/g.18950  ORF Transcript_10388/g.18950 Transcript_10388/m.18950 type:complete len:200 (-) Transcript_10388:387-986(-)